MANTQAMHQITEQPEVPTGRLRYLAARLHYAHLYRSSEPSAKAKMLAFPEQATTLKKELSRSKLLGITSDDRYIYLFDYHSNSSVIREIGRLRELTFRAVGEGTQKPRDIDGYDKTYRHIILWDESAKEIVGSYRIGEAFKIRTQGRKGALYTDELFTVGNQFEHIYPYAVELGRSFIQPKYWSKKGLDSLWQGIGAYLATHPHVRYLFGGVSISNDYPEIAKQQIIGLYQHFFKPQNASAYASARMPYRCNRAITEAYRRKTYHQAFKELKTDLAAQNLTIPVLFKHYVELCHKQGVKFIDFNIDPDFSFCIDGLILIDLNQIKESKRRRYLKTTPPLNATESIFPAQ